MGREHAITYESAASASLPLHVLALKIPGVPAVPAVPVAAVVARRVARVGEALLKMIRAVSHVLFAPERGRGRGERRRRG